jgi:hypothetical protein
VKNLTQDQWFSLIRSALMVVSGILISQGVLSQTEVTQLADEINKALPSLTASVSVLAPIAVTVWGIISHSMKSKIKSVAANPSIEKIVVARDAPVEEPAVTVAKDPTIPKVSFAAGNGGPKSVN